MSSRIIPAGFSLFLLCVLRRISFADLLARTRHDICSSMLYVPNYCCHSSSACPPFGIPVQLSGLTFILPKGVFLSYGSLKLFRDPRLCRGFSLDNKSKTTIKMAVLLLSFTKPFIPSLVVLRWSWMEMYRANNENFHYKALSVFFRIAYHYGLS